MPTRKQRRRRAKDFRHDVRVFEVDDEGNEIPLAELRPKEEAKPKKAEAKKGQQRKGAMREVPQPSWERALRRGGLMGGAMLLVFLFVLKSGPLVERLLIGIFYAVAFVPLTYWVDRMTYRTYLRRLERQQQSK